MIAAIYSRKSVFTGKGDSIENQIQICKEYGENKLGINNFTIYEDEGFSGGNINRPKFQELLQDITKKKFDVLICYRLDRISRNVADFSNTLEMLQNNNISFVSVKEQFDTSTPMGKAMVYIASVFAQLERDTIAERIRDNMLQLAKSGRWLGGQVPLGFKSEKITYLDTEYKERTMFKLTPIKEEMSKVKLIYDKYIQMGSISLTLKFLLSNNIKGKNGGDFSSMSINDILRNPVYVKSNNLVLEYLTNKGMHVCGTPNGHGILIYNKHNSKYKEKDISEWIAAVAKHEGIIVSDIWLEVQKKLDKNSKKDNPRQGTSKKSLLSGVLKCAKCGAPMRVSYGKQKKDESERAYYYTCTMKCNSGKSRCNNPNVRGDLLEKAVIDHISKLNKDVIINELESFKKESAYTTDNLIQNITKEIDNKKSEMDILLKNLSKANSAASDLIMSKVNNLGEEIKKLQSNLNNARTEKSNAAENKVNANIILDAINEFNTIFSNMDEIRNDEDTISKKRMLIETIIDKITWDGTTKKICIDLWGSKKK